jgi:hypothetical protein
MNLSAKCRVSLLCGAAVAWIGCAPTAAPQRNPFVTFTETFGLQEQDGGVTSPGGRRGTAAETGFRQVMSFTVVNTSLTDELGLSIAAWVNPSSIRSAEQQDALLSNGYVQLGREIRIGTAFVLPPGTFVLSGPGLAGAIPLEVRPGQGMEAASETLSFITPDVLLAFLEPPISCESVAFAFSQEGFPPDALTGASLVGGTRAPIAAFASALDALHLKTLAQVDAYQCNPLRPGLFLKTGGGVRARNEFFETEDVTIVFSRAPAAGTGIAATVQYTERP